MSEVIDRETARAEFERFAEAMSLDLDTTNRDENEVRDTEQDIERVTKAIIKGCVTIDEEGRASFVRRGSDAPPIVFYRPLGGSMTAMDRVKSHHEFNKAFASMAQITKTSISTFQKMHMSDVKICISIWTLFLA